MWRKLKDFFEHHEMSRNEVSVNINLVKHFFEHLAVFEGDYSEYIYESEGSIKIY